MTSLTQLAEAILTEPDPALASIPGSIRLADTRTPADENDASGIDAERRVFLPSALSDDGSDDGSEDGTAQVKGRLSSLETNGSGVMGNPGARVSRIEVSPVAGRDGDIDWEDGIDDIDEQGSGGGKPGGLSSKAGSILVCIPLIAFIDGTSLSNTSRDYTTYLSWCLNSSLMASLQ